MHDTSALVLPRLARLRREHLVPALYRATCPVEIGSRVTPGEPVPFAEAEGQTYEPLMAGSSRPSSHASRASRCPV